jgi:CheY-like chemotaxis protein
LTQYGTKYSNYCQNLLFEKELVTSPSTVCLILIYKFYKENKHDHKSKTLSLFCFISISTRSIKVDTYNDPVIALDNFKNGIYDFILLDIKMAPINGIELYKRIRDIDKKVKVFIFTATDYTFDEFKKMFFI